MLKNSYTYTIEHKRQFEDFICSTKEYYPSLEYKENDNPNNDHNRQSTWILNFN